MTRATLNPSTQEPQHGTEWQVTQCTCGHLSLRLGDIRIEFTRDEFARLERLVAEAMKRFEVEASDTAVSYNKPLTH